MGDLLFYLGGAKSGKTRRALARAETFPAPRYYLATAEALDEEMERRIKNHQAERGPDWRTLEAPLTPDKALAEGGGQVLLMDCLTLWLNNLLGQSEDSDWILSRVRDLAAAVKAYPGTVILVSNELGQGIVPLNPLARQFRDLAGAANEILAAEAREVIMVVAGLELRLK